MEDNLIPAARPVTAYRDQPPALIRATDDASAVRIWLERYHRSPNTFRAYEREAHRFLGWAHMQGLAMGQITVEDANNYLRWLANPPQGIIGKKKRRGTDDWRPLNKPLSEKSLSHSRTILATLYRFMCDANYLTGNPFALVERIVVPKEPMERYLEKDLWQHLQDYLSDVLPTEPGVTQAHAERCGWIFTFLYHTGFRISELAGAKMGDFRQREGKWWLRVLGKGKKIDFVPVTDLLFVALGRYRISQGLSPLPSFAEETPVVGRVSKPQAPVTAQAIHKVIKQVFARFGAHLESQGQAALAQHVVRMSAHWMRHTTASHQLAEGVPFLHVSKNLRHGKPDTTMIYTHVERDQRHDAMRGFGKKPTA